MENIRAQYITTLFSKEEFMIAKYQVIEDDGTDGAEVTVLGDSLPTTKGVTYKMDGDWRENARYGRQFIAKGVVLSVGTTAKEITGYITSLPGIGKKTAEKIYAVYGQDTFKALDEGVEALTKIAGISAKKAIAIVQAWQESHDTAEVYKALMDYGVTSSLTAKICREFPGTVWDMIEHYPYGLTRVTGFTFEIADALAYDKGFSVDNQTRIETAARAVLVDNERSGHLGMKPMAFLTALQDKLTGGRFSPIPRATLVQKANAAVLNGQTITATGIRGDGLEQYIYRTFTRETETETAHEIAMHLMDTPLPDGIEKVVDEAFKEAGLEPDEAQKQAVLTVFSNRLTVVTGGPGTGKTTIMKVIQAVYRRLFGWDICFLAPTGRAARRLSESVDAKASTIHSRLRIFGTDDMSDDFIADSTIQDGLVIIDESSMIDIWVAHKLLESTSYNSRMVFVGDPAQLQSVGAGAFFRDMIGSDCIPVAHLSRIFRQAQGSAIIANSQKIEDGDTNLFTSHDFEITDHMSGDTLYEAMVTAYIRDCDKYGMYQTVCLVPTCREVEDMNTRIQAAVNPPTDTKRELTRSGQIFRESDLVMHLKNREELANGDIGTVINVNPGAKTVMVRYYGETTVVYKKEDIDQITLAYAMTVHKAQGSEYQSVITCLQDSNRHMKIRSIPYTAITRARTICRFFGSYRALQEAVLVDDRQRRQTLLARDIQTQTMMDPIH